MNRSTGSAPDLAECERFLVHEAQLLDDARFDDWLALFTLNAWYWVPSEPGQDNPHNTVSLIYDDRRLLETRVRRLASPRIYSQEPRSRTSRIVTNVGYGDPVENESICVIRSKFQLVEFRRNAQTLFAGTLHHHLLQEGNSFRIAGKRVDLVNCDGPMDGLVVPL